MSMYTYESCSYSSCLYMTDSVLSLVGTCIRINLEYVLLNDIADSITLKIVLTRAALCVIFTHCVVSFPDSIHALHCIMCMSVHN